MGFGEAETRVHGRVGFQSYFNAPSGKPDEITVRPFLSYRV
jgi:hypothetical protein